MINGTLFYWIVRIAILAALILYMRGLLKFSDEQKEDSGKKTLVRAAFAALLLTAFLVMPTASRLALRKVSGGVVTEKSVNESGVCVVTVEKEILFLTVKKRFFVLPKDFESAETGVYFDAGSLPYKAD